MPPDQVGGGTGLQKQVGPLKAWQWIAAVAALAIGYYLYRQYQNNQAANNTNTGTDPNALIDPTTGQPYATESGSAYDPYGYGYQSLQSQLTSMLYDPTTGEPYYQEFAANQAAQTSANQALENAIATLSQQIQTGFQSITPPVPSPSPQGGTTPGGGGSGGAGNNTVVPSPGLPSGTGGNNTSTGGGNVPPQPQLFPNFTSTAPSAPIMSNLPIATQIQMLMSGTITKAQLGPNALKIYNAGGISTALPNAAAVQKARQSGLLAGAPLGVH